MAEKILQKETAFAWNVKMLRKYVFNFGFLDVTRMTGIAQASMSSYEKADFPVSPTLAAAGKIAKLFCTDLARLCSFDAWADPEETVMFRSAFIVRCGGKAREDIKRDALSHLDGMVRVTEYGVFMAVGSALMREIRRLCRERKTPPVTEDLKAAEAFSENISYLVNLSGVASRRLSEVTGIGAGTVSRLMHGSEPSLSTVLRLADFFSVPVEEILSERPDFGDFTLLVGKARLKTSLSDETPAVPEDITKKIREMKGRAMEAFEAEELVNSLLKNIET